MNYLINTESNNIFEYDQDYYTLSKNLRTEPWRQATSQEVKPYLVEKHIPCIKQEAHTRITAIYPITKQLNLIYAQAFEQDDYRAMVAFIENIRAKSNALELKIAKYTIKQLETFDCSDDKHWTD
jgi:hypothetical protein